MEAGLALDQAMGSGCVICGGLARYSLCSSLQQTHLATSSKLTHCKGGAEVFIGLHSPHT